MFVNSLYSARNPVFPTDFLAEDGGAMAHLFAGSGSDRAGEGIIRELLDRNRTWAGAELKDALRPEWLVGEHRDDDRRKTGAQRGSGHARPAVMHGRAHLWEEPVVGARNRCEHVVGKSTGGQLLPPATTTPRRPARVSARTTKSVAASGPRERCASKADEHRRRT